MLNRRPRRWPITLVCAALLTGSIALAADGADSAAAEQPGSWQPHNYDFHYMGFTSTYSCDGLADKLQLLLRVVGASPDAKVIPLCARSFGRPDKLAEASLRFSTLQLADANAPGASAGVWRHVELTPRHPFNLQTGDCELVEQFRDTLLPMFVTRNLDTQVTCVPHQESGSNFRLSFDVFAPAPPAKGAPAKAVPAKPA